MATFDLQSIWDERATAFGGLHSQMDEIVNIYLGGIPDRFNDFFAEGQHVHHINQIRLAWDDLANLAGKVFPIAVDSDNDTATAKQRAEHQEQIGYWYNDAGLHLGGIDMKMLMKILMWWLVGCAEAVPMVLPEYDAQTPYFTFRDPRTHYPPVGWSPFGQAPLSDTLFAYPVTIGELKRRFPDKETELGLKLNRTTTTRYGTSQINDSTAVWVGEYYHRDVWAVETLTDERIVLARSEAADPGHPGVVPVAPFALYSPGSAKGRSVFADQVSLQAALARMFSQKLDYYDQTLYPMIFTTPLSDNTVRVGGWAINEWDWSQSQIQPKVEVVSPRNNIDADQTMSFVIGLSRMLNRNPEQFQGQGDADSAKALDALKAGVNTTIREMFWPPAILGLPKLYRAAAEMDVELWGNVSKRARGSRKGAQFNVAYRPNTHLRGREQKFMLEPGLGLAGYQGMIQLLQLRQAGAISQRTMLEQGEWTAEVEEELRLIQSDWLDELVKADLGAKAAQGLLKPGAPAAIRKLVQEGEDMIDAIGKLETQGELMQPPPQMPGAPPGAGAPGGPTPPGLPPELAGLMGGGGPPPLSVIQGGRR